MYVAFSRICADGGANRVFNFFRQGSAEDVPKPSVILGDLDSITPAVHDHYKSIGVECLDMRKDQDSTDLDKCLAYVKDEQEKQRRKDGAATNQEDLVVVVGLHPSIACRNSSVPAYPVHAKHRSASGLHGLAHCTPNRDILQSSESASQYGRMHTQLLWWCGAGALGGRLDHTLGNLNSLYTHPNQNIVLVGEGNVVRLLQAGTTHVHVSKELGGLHCGVIPLREAVHVTSKGLKWDMGAVLC